jgi:hypothetical protein
MCGALAIGSNHRVGVGFGKPQNTADSAAFDDRRAKGGMGCEISLYGCNS